MDGNNECVTFIWTISNLIKEEKLFSPEFHVNSLRESIWKLGVNMPSSVHEGITIEVLNEYYNPPSNLILDFEVSIVSTNPANSITVVDKDIVFPIYGVHEIGGFPSYHSLLLNNEHLHNNTLQIECKMWRRNVGRKNLTPLFYQASTNLGFRKLSFDWSIKLSDIEAGSRLHNRFYLGRSFPIFSVEAYEGLNNNLAIGFDQENSDFYESDQFCKIYVLDARKNVCLIHECSPYELFEVPELIDIAPLGHKIMNDELNLVFEFFYQTGHVCSEIISVSTTLPDQALYRNPGSSSTSNLLTQMRRNTVVDASTETENESILMSESLKDHINDLYRNTVWSDVVLLAADGNSFPCHKCILSARSPVLKSLLWECVDYKLTLNIKSCVLNNMLQFIYGREIGTMSMNFNKAVELYNASREYEIGSLRSACSKYFENNMREDNVCDILIVSSKLQDSLLKKKAEAFILKKAADVFVSEKFKDLVKTYPEHLLDILRQGCMEKEIQNSSRYSLKLSMAAAISAVQSEVNFLPVYQSSQFSDFTLRTKSGKKFYVHRNILWARSPVFKAMLSRNMEGNSVNTLDIDMDEQTMENFLTFLYSGEVKETELKDISELFFQGDKYQISSLKDLCSDLLIQVISMENVCDILTMSYQHGKEKLRIKVIDFLAKSRTVADSVISSPNWKKLEESHKKLVSATMNEVYSRLNSNTAYSEVNVPFENVATGVLQINLLSLYEEKMFSDCKLCTNDRSFEVHKNILSARSPVFKAMFSNSWEEATTSTLNIPDIDGQTVDQMLRYIYFGTLENSRNVDIYSLYYAADKYLINSLKDLCSHLLRKKLSTKNVCEILLLANRHGDTSLEKDIQCFLIKKSNYVFNCNSWKAFMSNEPRVACETMFAICLVNLNS